MFYNSVNSGAWPVLLVKRNFLFIFRLQGQLFEFLFENVSQDFKRENIVWRQFHRAPLGKFVLLEAEGLALELAVLANPRELVEVSPHDL